MSHATQAGPIRVNLETSVGTMNKDTLSCTYNFSYFLLIGKKYGKLSITSGGEHIVDVEYIIPWAFPVNSNVLKIQSMGYCPQSAFLGASKSQELRPPVQIIIKRSGN